MSLIFFKIFLLLMPLILLLFYLHVRLYWKLYESLKRRGESVNGLEVGILDFGSAGCMTKIKTVEKLFGDGRLSVDEKSLIVKSKTNYYLAGTGVAVFMIGIVLLLMEGLQK